MFLKDSAEGFLPKYLLVRRARQRKSSSIDKVSSMGIEPGPHWRPHRIMHLAIQSDVASAARRTRRRPMTLGRYSEYQNS